MNISTNVSINTYADSDYYNHYNIKNSDDPNKTDSTNRPSSPEECQTCKNRKYADGSDENVSYKSAAHIAPGAAGNAVRAHEGGACIQCLYQSFTEQRKSHFRLRVHSYFGLPRMWTHLCIWRHDEHNDQISE